MKQRGDDFGTIGVGVPYYKAQYDFFRWFIFVIAGGMRAGDGLLNNHNVCGEVPIPMAHNSIVREMLRRDFDTMLIMEDDHVADMDIIERMRTKPENLEYDIICASYTNRRQGHRITPVGCMFNPGDVSPYGEYGMRIDPLFATETGTQTVDVAALGLVLVRRWVLEAMLGDEHPENFFWFDWLGHNSQDVRFYWKTREVGALTGVDRDNPVGHIGKKIYTMQQYYDWRNAALAKEDQKERKKREEADSG